MCWKPTSSHMILCDQLFARVDFAHYVKELVDVHYPQAKKILLVTDHLNTHSTARSIKRFLRPRPVDWLKSWKSIIHHSTQAGLIWRKSKLAFYHGNVLRAIPFPLMICVTRFARGSFAETRLVFPSIGILLLLTPELNSKCYIQFCCSSCVVTALVPCVV